MKIKNSLKILGFILIVSFLLSPTCFAHGVGDHVHHDHHHDDHDEHDDDHHDHEGIHGGYFADANDIYHVEFILEKEGMLKMYLFDEHTNPLKVTGIPATWTLAPDNEYPLKGNFKESEDGEYYWVQFPEHLSEVVHLEVHVQKNENWPALEYYLPVGHKEPDFYLPTDFKE